MAYCISHMWEVHSGERLPFEKAKQEWLDGNRPFPPLYKYHFKNGKIKNRFIKACLRKDCATFYSLLHNKLVGFVPVNFSWRKRIYNLKDALELKTRAWWKWHNPKYQRWRKEINKIIKELETT